MVHYTCDVTLKGFILKDSSNLRMILGVKDLWFVTTWVTHLVCMEGHMVFQSTTQIAMK